MKIQSSKFKVQKNNHCEERSDEAIFRKIATRFQRSRWALVFSLSLASCFLFFVTHSASAALLYSGAANEVTYQNHTFVVEWYLDTQGQVINSVDLKLHFTSGTLQVVSAEAGASDLNLWVKTPAFDNKAGTIELIGGVAGGLNTSKMAIFRTTFMAKALGPAQIYADDSSTALLSDGQGTRLKISFMRLSFPVVDGTSTGVTVSSDTHPDETVWYKNNNVELEVYPKNGDVYSYSFSSNPEITPDDKADDVSKKFTFNNLPDGIYYFKLASKTGNGAWTEALVRRFQIDETAPQPFTLKVASDPGVLSGQAFVSFATTDKASGIDRYEIRFGTIGSWTKTNQTYAVLPKVRLSDHIQVKAIDKAGNERFAEIVYNPSNKWYNFSNLLIWIIIIIGISLLIWITKLLIRHTRIGK